MSEGVQTLAVELGGGLTPLSDGVSGRNLIRNTQRRMELFWGNDAFYTKSRFEKN